MGIPHSQPPRSGLAEGPSCSTGWTGGSLRKGPDPLPLPQHRLPQPRRWPALPVPFLDHPWPHLGGQEAECEGTVLGTAGRGAKLTCRVAVSSLEMALGLPGADPEVFLPGWSLGAEEGAAPPLSAGAPGPNLSLQAQPGGAVLSGYTHPVLSPQGTGWKRGLQLSCPAWPRQLSDSSSLFCRGPCGHAALPPTPLLSLLSHLCTPCSWPPLARPPAHPPAHRSCLFPCLLPSAPPPPRLPSPSARPLLGYTFRPVSQCARTHVIPVFASMRLCAYVHVLRLCVRRVPHGGG